MVDRGSINKNHHSSLPPTVCTWDQGTYRGPRHGLCPSRFRHELVLKLGHGSSSREGKDFNIVCFTLELSTVDDVLGGSLFLTNLFWTVIRFSRLYSPWINPGLFTISYFTTIIVYLSYVILIH